MLRSQSQTEIRQQAIGRFGGESWSWLILVVNLECALDENFAESKREAIHCQHRARPGSAVVHERACCATGLNVSGEQCTVALVADLREVSDRGRRIRDKLEAVFCRRCKRGPRSWCPHRHPNRGGGVLDVIPGEPGCRVAERQPRFNAAPVNAERSEESTHKSQCMSGVEAVRNTKGVEDGAKVLDMKNGLAAVQVDLYTAVGDLSRPQD